MSNISLAKGSVPDAKAIAEWTGDASFEVVKVRSRRSVTCHVQDWSLTLLRSIVAQDCSDRGHLVSQGKRISCADRKLARGDAGRDEVGH